MTIKLKNKYTLIFDEFEFKCCIGKYGLTNNKQEGDKKTPKGIFSLANLYFRKDRNSKPHTKLKIIPIKKNMAWSHDIKSKKTYNKLIYAKKGIRYEKLFRRDFKYDFLIPIKYNWKHRTLGKGSAIFIHLTKNYKSTAGCIGLKKKDFLILIKLINSKTKIIIS